MTKEDVIREEEFEKVSLKLVSPNSTNVYDAFILGGKYADGHPLIEKDEYTALQWPEIQEYMESPRWKEVGYDPKKDLWFVPKDMIK